MKEDPASPTKLTVSQVVSAEDWFASLETKSLDTYSDTGGIAYSSILETLRLRLAIHGWVSPTQIFQDFSENQDYSKMLGELSASVQVSPSDHPGLWFMKVEHRRDLFARTSKSQVSQVAEQNLPLDYENDLIRAAILQIIGEELSVFQLRSKSLDALRAISSVLDWFYPDSTLIEMRHHVSTLIAGKKREADRKRLSHVRIFGSKHKEALSNLVQFAAGKRTLEPSPILNLIYLQGIGGSGKSTLLAHAQTEFSQLNQILYTLKFDFDDGMLDPNEATTLDADILRQLAFQLPEHTLELLNLLRMHERIVKDERDRRQRNSVQGDQLKARVDRDNDFQASGDEAFSFNEKSESESLLHRAFSIAFEHVRIGVLVVILDTFEVVVAKGEAQFFVAEWLGRLTRIILMHGGSLGFRIIVSGRDPIDTFKEGSFIEGVLNVTHRITKIDASPKAVRLGNLSNRDAIEFLEYNDVKPSIAKVGASLFTRNPLLLKTLVPILQSENSISSEATKSKIQSDAARQYLLRRVAAHMMDPVARPYTLACLSFPIMTRDLLQYVVIPSVGDSENSSKTLETSERQDLTARVFEALRAARWLVRSDSVSSSTILFNHDLRPLVLQLMRKVPEWAHLKRRLHNRAAMFYNREASLEHRAWHYYHSILAGLRPQTPTDVREFHSVLGLAVADLSRARQKLIVGSEGPIYSASPVKLNDDDWQAYLEDQGSKLVRRNEAPRALELFRSRPFHGSLIPTFAIQALADTGNWDSGEVEIGSLIQELREFAETQSALDSKQLSRFYWIVRFALIRSGTVPLHHEFFELLGAICSKTKASVGFSQLPPLVAVAEGLRRRDYPHNKRSMSIAGNDWLTSKQALSVNARLVLVRGLAGLLDGNALAALLGGPEPLRNLLSQDDLLITQRSWAEFLSISRADTYLSGCDTGQLQSKMNALDGLPLAEFSKQLREIGKESKVAVRWKTSNRRAGVLLLRGTTVELYRPLAFRIMEAIRNESTRSLAHKSIRKTLRGMTISPAELKADRYFELVDRDPKTWVFALVYQADRARLLPMLCRNLLEEDGLSTELKNACETYLMFDDALTDSIGSGWYPNL